MGERVMAEEKIAMIPVIQIISNKFGSRRYSPNSELRGLSESIEKNGIIQPLTVRQISDCEYEIISGERRLRAAVLAGLYTVPCIVIHCEEINSAVYRLAESLCYESHSCFEQAKAIKDVMYYFNYTTQELAVAIGVSTRIIENKLALLQLTNDEQLLMEEEGLNETYAHILLRLTNAKLRKEVLTKVVENNLNVAQTNILVNKLLNIDIKKKTVSKPTIIIKDLRPFFNTVSKALGLIRNSGINATEIKNETDREVEYIIKIQKN